MGNSFSPDLTVVDVDYSFADHPTLGSNTIKIALGSTVKHFKKIVQTDCSFVISGYQVQYGSKLHKDSDRFQTFWSTNDRKEVLLLKPSITGS